MRLAIVSAMNDEIKFLLDKFEKYHTEVYCNFTFYIVNYHNHELIISKSGCGKTAAGLLMGVLSSHYKVDYVINTGICGGRRGFSNVGDLIVMDNCVYGDFSVCEITDNAYGQISGYPQYFKSDRFLLSKAKDAKIGDFLTQDRFMTSYEETEGLITKYFKHLNICGFDMESAAFAQASYHLNIPFIAIRTTSDVVGTTSTDEYNEQSVDLCKLSCDYLYKYLCELI